MELLQQRILSDGKVLPGGILKVDGFLNHQIDPALLYEMAQELKRLYAGEEITKILTIEASGIAIAAMVGYVFGCPLVFAKKSKSKNISPNVYSVEVESFTHGNTNTVVVSKEYLKKGDRVLIIDDFMAKGYAMQGLIDIVNAAGATLVGIGCAVEKGFQGGGDRLRAAGVNLKSLAIIESAEPGNIVFRGED